VSVGLIALLDDIAAIAKVAAAQLDDVATQAAKAGAKAAGVVIDDAAVTPRYMTGFAAARELPIIRKIAVASIRNKLLILLPAALALSFFLPSAITPLLMLGGAYLCYEGAEKVFEAFFPEKAHAHEAGLESIAIDPKTLEDQKVASAIKTDFILSAEVMAIALSVIPESNIWTQAAVLAVVAVGITAVVYGAVAIIVKADDVGMALAANQNASVLGSIGRSIGRALVYGMPGFLTLLSIVGTTAMLWVGGGIIVHGLETYGYTSLGHVIQHAAEVAAHAVPFAQAAVEWIVGAAGAGVTGLIIGAALIPVTGYAIAPAWKVVKGLIRSAKAA
jgi:predicted DNA repair protein MutK